MKKDRVLCFLVLVLAAATNCGADGAFTAAAEGYAAKPATVVVDFTADCGPVKPMNAVNNRAVGDAVRGNAVEFKAARIPYGRTHDASEFIGYGGDHVIDVTAVFPDFDADETDPKSYDFAITDAYLHGMRASGSEPFYRLGQRIESAVRRYNIYPPKDFAKWTRICEHIIRHYNEGWANGRRWNIRYWEIWNEADIDFEWEKRGGKPHMWGGTAEEFFRFYETAAKHLKGTFPMLKIGGPAVTGGDFRWSEMFLKYQQEHHTPMDFFSWHHYARDPMEIVGRAKRYREMMDRYGYAAAESILNEWNYVRHWGKCYHYSVKQASSQKGAAFVAAAMIACQYAPVDMLMYYDAKPTADFNGLFDRVSFRPLAPYYAFYAWGRLSTYQRAVKASADIPDIYAVAARGAAGQCAIMVARYSDDDNFATARPVTVRLLNGRFPMEVSVHLTDVDRRHTEIRIAPKSETELCLMMDPHSFALVEFCCEGLAEGRGME